MQFSLLLSLISLLALPGVRSQLPCNPLPSNTTNADATAFAAIKFDYLIIGGGTAGLVVANRLSEDPNVQVGVIEAGIYHYDDPAVDVPVNAGNDLDDPNYDWSFKTVPQPGADGRQISASRGKMLGGSSGLNSITWNRASQPEYDAWENFSPSWSWNGMLSYFQKCMTIIANQTNPFPGITAEQEAAAQSEAYQFEGFQGPINASLNVWYSDAVPPYVEAANSINISTNANADNGNSAGIYNSRSAVDQVHGVRSYGASAYYCPYASRSNFHILVDAQVTKVMLSQPQGSSNYTATGVLFSAANTIYAANATKEIILSAGAVQTPQLLELSGIGNSTLLQSLGIETLIDLPQVGENLQEHVFSPVEFLLTPGHHTFDELRNNATFAAEQQALYNATHTGIMAATDSTLTFIPFQTFLNETTMASLSETFEATVQNQTLTPIQQLQYPVHRDWLSNGTVPQIELLLFNKGTVVKDAGDSYITILAGIQHPWSRGSVHINSSDPLAAPLIDPQFLANEYDLQSLLQVVKLALKLGETSPLASNIQSIATPAANVTSDEDLIEYIRSTASPGYHLSCTAPLAPQDQGGVVNDQLVVYGTNNLRVADASIMPLLLAAHLQETIYAIGEKAADIIKGTNTQ